VVARSIIEKSPNFGNEPSLTIIKIYNKTVLKSVE